MQGVFLEITRNNLTKNTKQETTSQELNMHAMMSFKRAQEVATTSDKCYLHASWSLTSYFDFNLL